MGRCRAGVSWRKKSLIARERGVGLQSVREGVYSARRLRLNRGLSPMMSERSLGDERGRQAPTPTLTGDARYVPRREHF